MDFYAFHASRNFWDVADRDLHSCLIFDLMEYRYFGCITIFVLFHLIVDQKSSSSLNKGRQPHFRGSITALLLFGSGMRAYGGASAVLLMRCRAMMALAASAAERVRVGEESNFKWPPMAYRATAIRDNISVGLPLLNNTFQSSVKRIGPSIAKCFVALCNCRISLEIGFSNWARKLV